jgi:sorting nexin-1/2
MQLDAEEDENAFYKPPVEPTARPPNERLSGETSVESQAAATITAEEDDD